MPPTGMPDNQIVRAYNQFPPSYASGIGNIRSSLVAMTAQLLTLRDIGFNAVNG